MSITITAKEKQILQEVNIPPRPEVLLQVSQEAKQPEPDVARIADAISSDVSIAAAVLQVVNSAAFARAREVKSIQQAVMTLGFKRIFPLIKAVALKSSMSGSDTLANVWELGSQVASVSALVAKELDKPALGDNAYMLGLFHISGIAVMVQHFDGYERVVDKANQVGWDRITDVERKHFSTAHTTIGALLAQKWKLPTVLAEIIYYHQDAEGIFSSAELPQAALELLAILKISRKIVADREQLFNVDTEWSGIEDELLNFLDLDDDQMMLLIENVNDSLATTEA